MIKVLEKRYLSITCDIVNTLLKISNVAQNQRLLLFLQKKNKMAKLKSNFAKSLTRCSRCRHVSMQARITQRVYFSIRNVSDELGPPHTTIEDY